MIGRRGRLACLAAIAAIPAPSASVQAQTVRQKAERLAAIAVSTEWVVTNCGVAGLDGMLLLTMRSVIRQLALEDAARLRANFARRVAGEFPTRARACDVWKARLIEIQ